MWSGILRDCADPDVFCPQRYLNDDSLPDPFEVIFGFGRRLEQAILIKDFAHLIHLLRICPGRHFAEAGYWGIASRMIAAFDISKPLDASGKEMNIPLEFTHGFVRYGVLSFSLFNRNDCDQPRFDLAILSPSSVPSRPDPPTWLVLLTMREQNCTCDSIVYLRLWYWFSRLHFVIIWRTLCRG